MNDAHSNLNGDQTDNTETSDLNIMLSKRSILTLSLILYLTFQSIDELRHIIAPIGLSLLIIYWIFWSFMNESKRDHKKKISSGIGALVIVGTLYIILRILSLYDVLNILVIDWKISFFIGIIFIITAFIIKNLQNLLSLSILFLVIITWSIDTIFLTYNSLINGNIFDLYLVFVHLIFLYWFLQGVRGIRAIQIENIPDIDQDLVKNIAINFREKSSQELRIILSDGWDNYSQEAFEAIRQILDERDEHEKSLSKEEIEIIQKNEQMERIAADLEDVEENLSSEKQKLPKLKFYRKISLFVVVALLVFTVTINLFAKQYGLAVFLLIIFLLFLFLLDRNFAKRINETIKMIAYFNSQIENLKEERRGLSD